MCDPHPVQIQHSMPKREEDEVTNGKVRNADETVKNAQTPSSIPSRRTSLGRLLKSVKRRYRREKYRGGRRARRKSGSRSRRMTRQNEDEDRKRTKGLRCANRVLITFCFVVQIGQLVNAIQFLLYLPNSSIRREALRFLLANRFRLLHVSRAMLLSTQRNAIVKLSGRDVDA
ncbi:hypothetical protein HDV57DRAFT_434955 [Trichoderma longibrachiatum]